MALTQEIQGNCPSLWPHIATKRNPIGEEAGPRQTQNLLEPVFGAFGHWSCENTPLLFISHWFYGSLGITVKTEKHRETI